jgi:surface antigen
MILEILAIKEINKPPEIPQPKPTVTIKVEKKKETKPKKIYYTIKKNDTITKVSKRFRVPVSRVICANKQLHNPDLIMPSERLRIPHKKDKLKCAKIKPSDTKPNKPLVNSGGFSSSENLYEPGQCVWAIKNWRPEIPNTWGNATDWLANAQAQGWPTGSTPRVGAVGWTYGHVVLITAVHKNGTVDIKDMNGRYVPFEIGYGTYPASKYQYIY